MVLEESAGALWHFDGAELYHIWCIKERCSNFLSSWKLKETYWSLRDLRREIDAKLKRNFKKYELESIDERKGEGSSKNLKTEKDIVDEKMKELDNAYTQFNLKGNQQDEQKTDFYLKLEDFYMFLSHLMKRHKLFFREGDDTLAVLRR